MPAKVSCAQRIREGLSIRNMLQKDLCENTGIPKSAMSQYCNGAFEPKQDRVSRIAEALNVSEAWLMGYNVPMERDSQRHDSTDKTYPSSVNATDDIVTFRVNVDIAAGYDQPASPLSDWESTTIDVPVSALHGRTQEDFFAIRITGNSMYPHYQDGDCVLIQRADTLDYSGQVGVMLCGDEGTIKKIEYVEGEDWLRLIPFNPEYAPKKIEGVDLEQCRVIGIPKLLIRDL